MFIQNSAQNAKKMKDVHCLMCIKQDLNPIFFNNKNFMTTDIIYMVLIICSNVNIYWMSFYLIATQLDQLQFTFSKTHIEWLLKSCGAEVPRNGHNVLASLLRISQQSLQPRRNQIEKCISAPRRSDDESICFIQQI